MMPGGKRFAFSSGVLAIALIIWFLTPAPTTAARYVWSHYQMASLALILDRTDAKLAYTIGNYAFGGSTYNLPLAKRAFQKAVSIDNTILYGHYQIARILFVEGKLPEAAVEVDKELAVNPYNLRSLYVRGLIRAYAKDFAGSEADFSQFIKWSPTEWAGYNDLAWVLAQELKYTEAEAVLKQSLVAATNATTNPWIWNNLGVQQLNLQEYKAATISFEKAKKLAATLTEKEWRTSYPGNDPVGSAQGIESFQTAIQTNLDRATSGY